MRKKGFTLVELLGVIVLLGIIGLIAVPTVNTLIKKSRERAIAVQEKEIINAAKSWSSENTSSLPDDGMIFVKIQDLIDGNYIPGDTIDKINDTKYSTMCVKITADTKYNNYDYAISNCN